MNGLLGGSEDEIDESRERAPALGGSGGGESVESGVLAGRLVPVLDALEKLGGVEEFVGGP